jgi:hypothetical protein
MAETRGFGGERGVGRCCVRVYERVCASVCVCVCSRACLDQEQVCTHMHTASSQFMVSMSSH